MTLTIINEANERVNEELQKKKESSLVAHTRLPDWRKRAKYGLKAYTIYYRYSIYLIIYIVKNEESRNQL